MMQRQRYIPPLKPDCVHEVWGPSAYNFALIRAAVVQGSVLLAREAWRSEQLNPLGMIDILPAENFLTVSTKNQTDTLASAEEALRSGVLGFVIMDLTAPLDLTAGRRLQLAARAGKTTGLAIISEDMGSNAAQTRWECQPLFDPQDSTLQRWKLIKNKSGTLGAWNVRWSATSRRINVVSQTGQ